MSTFHPAIAMVYAISESDLPVLDILTRLKDGAKNHCVLQAY